MKFSLPHTIWSYPNLTLNTLFLKILGYISQNVARGSTFFYNSLRFSDALGILAEFNFLFYVVKR